MVSCYADIRTGDKLITSGLGGRFPANYPVAVITKIDRPTGDDFATIQAEPLALLDQSREVLLIWHNQPDSEPEIESTTEAEVVSDEK